MALVLIKSLMLKKILITTDRFSRMPQLPITFSLPYNCQYEVGFLWSMSGYVVVWLSGWCAARCHAFLCANFDGMISRIALEMMQLVIIYASGLFNEFCLPTSLMVHKYYAMQIYQINTVCTHNKIGSHSTASAVPV